MPSTEEENELICEKLLGWERWAPNEERPADLIFRRPFVIGGQQHGFISERVPTFNDWASAGLILDALTLAGFGDITLAQSHGGWFCSGQVEGASPQPTVQLAIRAAALEYIARTP